VGVRVRPQQQQVEMDMVVRPRGENYSTSRGEHFARMVELSKPSNVVTEPYYKRYMCIYVRVCVHMCGMCVLVCVCVYVCVCVCYTQSSVWCTVHYNYITA